MSNPPIEKPRAVPADLLAIGFGTTVAMWAVGYVGHMPLTNVPPAVFVSLMLACVVGGGWVAGRKTARGAVGGISVGLVVALLNLLILGSLLSKPNSGQIVPQAALWVPGYFLLSMALASIGAAIGARVPRPARDSRRLARRVRLGRLRGNAIVDFHRRTSYRFCAGMAVSDWPATFGYNMFFYPFAKMTGGVFYEHAHRLMGSLVGLTTFTLAVLLTVHAPRDRNARLGLARGRLRGRAGHHGGAPRHREQRRSGRRPRLLRACRAGGHGVRGGLAVSEAAGLSRFSPDTRLARL